MYLNLPKIGFTNLTRRLVENTKGFSTTSGCLIKKIDISKDPNCWVIQGITEDSERKCKIVKEAESKTFCPECTLGLNIKHTDVLILSQYVRSDGCMLPRRVTGLCKRQQHRIGTMVTMAQKAGLMPNLAPANSKKDPKKRKDWKKFNTYYDESTIKAKRF